MKTKLFLTFPILCCFAMTSCYVIPDPQKEKPKEDVKKETTMTSEEQQKLEEQRKKMEEEKKAAEEKEKEEIAEKENEKEKEGDTTPKPPGRKPGDYPFANPVPGKEGFVFSPYNNKLVDVRDIPSGQLVRDPTYAVSEKKFFRVP
jgi:hypothetical protein